MKRVEDGQGGVGVANSSMSSRRMTVLGVAVAVLAGAGCAADRAAGPRAEAGAPPGAAPRMEEGAEPSRGERVTETLAYPTGDPDTSVLLVQKIAPEQVRVGERYRYTIRVENISDEPIRGIVVSENARGFQIETSQPAAEPTREQPGRWRLGTLAPGAVQDIQVTAVPRELGKQTACLTVDYEPTLCTAVQVVNPELQITKKGPQLAYACEPLEYTYEVTNVGTGVARNVIVEERLPEGLTTEGGVVRIELGDIAAGETERSTVRLAPTGTGTVTSRAVARSATDEVVSEPVRTRIVQPELAVDVSGPEWQYPEQPVNYSVSVTNRSNVPAREATLQYGVALEDESLDDAADETRRLGTLAPGETQRVDVTVEAGTSPLRFMAAAQSVCAPPVTASAVTTIRTVSALLLETVDTRDPVKVGETTSYEVVVRNQGDAPAMNVDVRALVPPNMAVVNATGPTEASLDGETLVFGTIPSLPPGETAAWRVQVRAQEPGSARFRTELEADTLRKPVPDVEPTQVIAAGPQTQPRG